jgi:hypothetical protein
LRRHLPSSAAVPTATTTSIRATGSRERTGYQARANAAQANSWKRSPAYMAGLAAAFIGGVDGEVVARIAMIFVVAPALPISAAASRQSRHAALAGLAGGLRQLHLPDRDGRATRGVMAHSLGKRLGEYGLMDGHARAP